MPGFLKKSIMLLRTCWNNISAPAYCALSPSLQERLGTSRESAVEGYRDDGMWDISITRK